MSDGSYNIYDLEWRQCHQSLLGDGNAFSRYLGHVITFSSRRYNLHGLGRIVSSHARSCVEDVTTRWLGLHLRPTAVRVQ